MGDLLNAPGVIGKASSCFLDVNDVMNYLGCKENKAYTIIRTLKKELLDEGRLTPAYPAGKIPKKYFMDRCMIEQ